MHEIRLYFLRKTSALRTCKGCTDWARTHILEDQFMLELSISPDNVDSAQSALDNLFSESDIVYECLTCGERNSDKKEVIRPENTPQALVLMLKCFGNSLTITTKITKLINIDFEITYAGQKYYLCSVIFHWGETVTSGHYLTYALYDKWYCYDDKRRTPAESDWRNFMHAEGFTPYILMYSKTS